MNKKIVRILRKTLSLLLVVFISTGQFFVLLPNLQNEVSAESLTLSSRVDFNNGFYNGTESVTKEGEVKLKASGAWGMRAWKTPNLPLGDQAAIASDGTYVYVLANVDNYFARYIPAENRWQTLTRAPKYAYQGANLVVLGNYIYAVYGGYQKEFSRYSIATNTWTELTDLPDLVQGGASATTDGSSIFLLRGTGTTDFWKYTPGTNSWTTISSTPLSINVGGGLVHYGGNLYAVRGVNTTTLYRYNISSNTWFTTSTLGPALSAAPAAFNEDHTIAIKGSEVFVTRDQATTAFYKYDIATNAWTTLAVTPQATRYVGAVYNAADDYVYVFRGAGTYDFWKYNPTTNAFLGPTDLPNTPGTGADLVYLSGYLYHPRGNATQNFYQYQISSGIWSALANTPATIGDDTKGIAAGSLVYFARGGNTRTFYSYNPSNNTWTTLADAPFNISYGGSLAYPGSGDFIYVSRGGLVSTSSFMRYSISGNSWDDASAADLPTNSLAGYGSRLVSNGTDLYYIGGSGVSQMLKYTVGTNTWSSLSSVPFSPYYGTDLAYYNGKIYAQAGYYKNDAWEYTINTNTWRRLDSMGDAYPYDAGPYNGGSLESDGAGTLYSISGQNLLWMQTYAVSANNFQSTGTWTSGVQDLSYVSTWTALQNSSTTPGNSSVSFETRTSADQTTWSNWEVVSGTTIASPINRYIQVRATLQATSDYTQSPTIASITIQYAGDQTSPTNPSTVNGFSQSVGGVNITTGGSYSYSQPYFSWSGASDGQTNITGYYVYFGTNAAADPAITGNFQSESAYVVTSALTNGTYYLRIKTKDGVGNLSSALTGFTYTYSGVSPPQSITKTLTSQFDGTATNVTVSGDQIKLSGKAGFWQEQRLSLAPAALYQGSNLAYIASSNKMYAFRGNNTVTFYEYDIGTDVWATRANGPATVNNGGALVEGPSGYLYAIRGQNTASFWRYDISANTWSDPAVSDAPQPFDYGAALVYDGSRYIYASKGNSDDTFMRYDTQSDTWDALANTDFGAPDKQSNNLIYQGGDLAYDGNGLIYSLLGNGRAGFSVYSISTNTWQVLANAPALANYGAQLEYDSTSQAVYYLPGWDKPFFYKYDIASQTWQTMPDAPATIGYGASMRNVNGIMHITRGANTQTFYKFDIVKNSWLIPNMGLFGGLFRGTDYRTFGYGADIVKGDGSNMYVTRGNYDNLFVRYNSSTGETTKMADLPGGLYVGAELVYDSVNNAIFATSNQYNRVLFRYDIATDVWVAVTTDPPPADVNTGGALEYDGSRYIYLIPGNSTALYRYDTQGSAGSRWSTMAVAPAAFGYGADLQYKSGYLYALRGNNTVAFYRYTVSSNTWSDPAVADLTAGATIYNDGFLIDAASDSLLACRGGNTTACYIYSIAGNTWTAIVSAPANIYIGGAADANGENSMYVIAGAGTNTIADGLYRYTIQSSTSSFQESGNYISSTHDLGSVYRYAGLNINYISAVNTHMIPYTRTSSDGSTWSAWSEASETKTIGTSYEYKINSVVNRYMQVKLNLVSGDGILTGTVSDYTIQYYQDTTIPTNATALSSYSTSTQSASIQTDTWYNYANPSFDWPDAEQTGGASDTLTGSGIAGYYIYFGTNSLADPLSDGNYSTLSAHLASGLTSGQTYYLRLKTKDNANNISSTVWAPFIYKYDSGLPANPPTIVVDPPGYTSQDNFTFSWLNATDSASLVSEYCYKTGAEDALESCTPEASVSGVLKYKTGANTFYVRTKDTAGNYSSDYATATYYYSSTAPGAPKNLRVTYPSGTTTNSVNEFAFAWDPPDLYYGQQSGLRYFYSINAHPTVNNVNTVGLSVTYLSKDAYGTQKGENILYVVAKDEAGNIDYSTYATVHFMADTSAPGAPANLDISDVSIKETSSWRLALSWDSPIATGSGVASYKVYRATTESASCTADFSDFNYVASTSQTSFVDTGLTQTKKYYCVKTCDSTNECSSSSSTVNLYPDGKWRQAAEMVASPSATVKTKSATITWSTNRESNSFVKYGKTSGDYGSEVGSSDQVTAHSIDLNGLDPGTTYYYKVLWTDEDGNSGSSDELSFSTNAAPFVSSVTFSNVSIYDADVTFTVKNAVKASVEYGETIEYGEKQTISTSKSELSYTVGLSGLTEGTAYHLHIVAEDDEGNTFAGDDYTFETLPVPKIENLRIQQVVGMPTATIRLIWDSNSPISSIVTYYPTAQAERALDQIKLALTTKHEIILKDLSDETAYTFVVKGKDSVGNEATTQTKNVTTSNDVRAPEIQNLNVETTIIGVGQEARAQIIVSWDTDEPATTQVEYAQGTGTTYGQATQEDTNLTLNHTVTIPGLTPSKIYHLRVLSKDKAKNISQSLDSVVITPRATQDALNLVIDNLSKTFGFLKNITGGN